MEKRSIPTWLTGLLALQLLLALALFWAQRPNPEAAASGPLLKLPAEQLSRIELTDGEQTLSLTRNPSGQWHLPALEQLPGDSERVQGLVNKLTALRRGWPVATSQQSQERFKVAEDNFERQITLYQQDEVAGRLYLGSSAGHQQAYVRLPEESEVYRGELAQHELPLDAEDWLDKSLLAAPGLSEIRGGDFQIRTNEGQWQWAQPEPESPPLAQAKAQQLARRLENLRIQGLVEQLPEAPELETSLEVRTPDAEYEYQLAKFEEQRLLHRNDRPQWFRVSEYNYDQLLQASRESLMAQEPKDQEASGTKPQDEKTSAQD